MVGKIFQKVMFRSDINDGRRTHDGIEWKCKWWNRIKHVILFGCSISLMRDEKGSREIHAFTP